MISCVNIHFTYYTRVCLIYIVDTIMRELHLLNETKVSWKLIPLSVAGSILIASI